jgi:hypothetical protein
VNHGYSEQEISREQGRRRRAAGGRPEVDNSGAGEGRPQDGSCQEDNCQEASRDESASQ